VIRQFDMGSCQAIGDKNADGEAITSRCESDIPATRLLTVTESKAAEQCRRFPAAVIMAASNELPPADD